MTVEVVAEAEANEEVMKIMKQINLVLQYLLSLLL
jgi:hypothetical protein